MHGRCHRGDQAEICQEGYDPAPMPFAGIKPIVRRNKGELIIHTGGKYDSHLLVPKIPR